MPSPAHHPQVSRLPDGQWVLRCPECQRADVVPPIGIGLPLQSQREAEMLRENHLGRARRYASWDSPSVRSPRMRQS